MPFISAKSWRLSLAALASVLVVVAGSSANAATTIDFEGTGGPDRFVNTAALTNRYSDLGVTFSAVGLQGAVPASILNVASNFYIGAHSGTDFLAFNNFIVDKFDSESPLGAPISVVETYDGEDFYLYPSVFSDRLSFNGIASNFGLFVGGGRTGDYTATFFNRANQAIGSQTITVEQGIYGLLSRADPFSSVVISSSNGEWVADDLSFDLTLVSPVPEPATWLMMILGFGFVGAALRRRRGAPQTA